MHLHCIDLSGSMSSDQIELARNEMLKRFKPGDKVAVFDIRFEIVTDMDRDFKSYTTFFGGTSAQSILDFAKSIGANTILYSDGLMIPDKLVQFNIFVEIK